MPIAQSRAHLRPPVASVVLRWLVAAGLVALGAIALAPAGLGAGDPRSPIERAIDFLSANQVRRPVDMIVNGARVLDFPGDWPQYFHLHGGDLFRVRDVSPFTVAYIHHALAGL